MITHKIDPKGKYIFIIEYEDGDRNFEDVSGFSEQLQEWWYSEDPFLIVAPYGGMKVRIEKVGEDK